MYRRRVCNPAWMAWRARGGGPIQMLRRWLHRGPWLPGV